MEPYTIFKILTANDVGSTGAHQAGIHVPKSSEILAFFPTLDSTEKNPRRNLECEDDSGEAWVFSFIYYNNKFFGGTRNEYRLTRMTPFMQEHGLASGDRLFLDRLESGQLRIRYTRASEAAVRDGGVLKLGTSWKVIQI